MQGMSQDTQAHPNLFRSDVPKRWRWHYRKLMIVRDLLQDHLISVAKEQKDQTAVTANSADAAAENAEMEDADTIRSADEESLAEVNAAILRILDGSYGVCEVTGSYIPADRLRAVPWTRYSTEAARTLEKQVRDDGGSHLDILAFRDSSLPPKSEGND